MTTRCEVLSLYKRILRLARQWKDITISTSSEEAASEQSYIQKEARTLFRKNKDIEDEDKIKTHMKEAETRLEMAMHYRMPYPRPLNFPQTLLPPAGKKLKKAQKRLLDRSKPLYLKSYDDT